MTRAQELARRRKYYRLHSDKCKMQSHIWRKLHPNWRKAYTYDQRKAHPSRENWQGMMQRCYDENSPDYPRYNGRGIRVYKRWHDFKIYEHDFGRLKPESGYTVDRIDDAKGYFPGNVQWLTKSAHAIKTRRNDGQT